MTNPTFLCIGAQKAGTSWLYRGLSQHKETFLPPIKEIHFFDYIHIKSHRAWIDTGFAKHAAKLAQDPAFASYLSRLRAIDRTTDAWYAEVFDHPSRGGKVAGEITPAYAILPPEGIRHVQSINPDLQIVFILRDPVDRALSHIRMMAARRSWKIATPEAVSPHDFRQVFSRSAYAENIANWESVFSPEQILYLPYPKIRRDPAGFMTDVENFLGLSHHRYRQLDRTVHVSRPVEIAPELYELIADHLKKERQFIDDRFGKEFM